MLARRTRQEALPDGLILFYYKAALAESLKSENTSLKFAFTAQESREGPF